MEAVQTQVESELHLYEHEMSQYETQHEMAKYETIVRKEHEKLMDLEASHKSQSVLISQVKHLRGDIESMCQQ